MDTKTIEVIRKLDWGIKWGSVEVTIRDGKATLITKKEAIKLD